MDVLDRHGWAEGMSILAQGRHIGFRTDKRGLMASIQERFPPGWKPTERATVERVYSLRVAGATPGPGPKKTHNLYANALRIQRSRDLDVLLDGLEANLQLYVAEQARRRVFVHAGVVRWHGQGIVIPGRSLTEPTRAVQPAVIAGESWFW